MTGHAPATLSRWRQALYEQGYTAADGIQRAYSINSINQRLAAVRSVMAEAAEQGYIPHGLVEQFKSKKGKEKPGSSRVQATCSR